jgi:hypothetical protein
VRFLSEPSSSAGTLGERLRRRAEAIQNARVATGGASGRVRVDRSNLVQTLAGTKKMPHLQVNITLDGTADAPHVHRCETGILSTLQRAVSHQHSTICLQGSTGGVGEAYAHPQPVPVSHSCSSEHI